MSVYLVEDLVKGSDYVRGWQDGLRVFRIRCGIFIEKCGGLFCF